QVRVVVRVPGMELEHRRPRRVDHLLVLVAAVAAGATEQVLVPAAARRHVADRDQRLRPHGSGIARAGPAGRSVPRSQFTRNTVETGAVRSSSRAPSLTTTDEPARKSRMRSGPV